MQDITRELKDVEKAINQISTLFCSNPERFLSEIEVQNELFRILLDQNVYGKNKWNDVTVMREIIIKKGTRRKTDIVLIDEKKDEILFAIEIKFDISNFKKLEERIKQDIIKIRKDMPASKNKGMVLYFNNFEDYSVENIATIESWGEKDIPVRVISAPREKIRLLQQKYLGHQYTPDKKVK